jgi:hypothetical protein
MRVQVALGTNETFLFFRNLPVVELSCSSSSLPKMAYRLRA